MQWGLGWLRLRRLRNDGNSAGRRVIVSASRHKEFVQDESDVNLDVVSHLSQRYLDLDLYLPFKGVDIPMKARGSIHCQLRLKPRVTWFTWFTHRFTWFTHIHLHISTSFQNNIEYFIILSAWFIIIHHYSVFLEVISCITTTHSLPRQRLEVLPSGHASCGPGPLKTGIRRPRQASMCGTFFWKSSKRRFICGKMMKNVENSSINGFWSCNSWKNFIYKWILALNVTVCEAIAQVVRWFTSSNQGFSMWNDQRRISFRGKYVTNWFVTVDSSMDIHGFPGFVWNKYPGWSRFPDEI